MSIYPIYSLYAHALQLYSLNVKIIMTCFSLFHSVSCTGQKGHDIAISAIQYASMINWLQP